MIELNIEKTIHTLQGKEILVANTVIPDNKITAIYGESGTGKTTLLRIIAGLSTPEKGNIKVKNKTWFCSEQKINIKAQQRRVGFVFQDYALFPNMTVKQNISFALKDRNNTLLLEKLLQETGLTNLSHQYPAYISGGQKQRVALARALALEPEVLLMDEPLSALDIETRIKLRQLILELHNKYAMTTILVSHDIPEIFSLADNVQKIKDNEIQEYGAPKDAFDKAILKQQFSALFE